DRVINTVRLCEDLEVGGHLVGIGEDGIHSVEGLLIARYMMFTQVYFHKTRVAYDYHYEQALKEILNPIGGTFPGPSSLDSLRSYTDWDDWKVLAALKAGEGKEHGGRLTRRDHYRLLHETPEVPDTDDMTKFDQA